MKSCGILNESIYWEDMNAIDDSVIGDNHIDTYDEGSANVQAEIADDVEHYFPKFSRKEELIKLPFESYNDFAIVSEQDNYLDAIRHFIVHEHLYSLEKDYYGEYAVTYGAKAIPYVVDDYAKAYFSRELTENEKSVLADFFEEELCSDTELAEYEQELAEYIYADIIENEAEEREAYRETEAERKHDDLKDMLWVD